MQIQVDTNEYEFSHGHRPRGRGLWAFEIGGEVIWSNYNQLYSQAVGDARKLAISMNLWRVKVMP